MKTRLIMQITASAIGAIAGCSIGINTYLNRVSQDYEVTIDTRERLTAIAINNCGVGAAMGVTAALLAVSVLSPTSKSERLTAARRYAEEKLKKQLPPSESAIWIEVLGMIRSESDEKLGR